MSGGTFSVGWDANALNMLAGAWTAAPDPGAVTAAADAIDRRLAADPLAHGTPVSEGLYAIEVPPLRALFEVDPTARTVTVVSVTSLP